MRPRDFILVAAVVLIAGFAAADALRGRTGGSESVQSASTPVQTTSSRPPGPAPQPEAPADWPVGAFEGSLAFTNAEDCRLRVVGLAGGRERPLARFSSDCDLWAPPVGERIAYGLGPASGDGLTPFKLADLSRPNADLGGYRALFGVVLWSPDGQRVAWCGRSRTGFDLEIGGASRRLPTCPAAYTPDSRIAYAVGNRLLVEDEQFVRAEGGITYVHFNPDGSVVVVVDGKRIEVYEPSGAKRLTVRLPPELQGPTPIVSPDGCAAILRLDQPPGGGIQIINLGCFEGTVPRFFEGRDAAWSPDSTAIAVAEPDAIVLHELVGGNLSAVWPAHAVRLAWRLR